MNPQSTVPESVQNVGVCCYLVSLTFTPSAAMETLDKMESKLVRQIHKRMRFRPVQIVFGSVYNLQNCHTKSYNLYLQFRLHLEDVFAYLYIFFSWREGAGFVLFITFCTHNINFFILMNFLLLKEWQIKEILNDKIIC